MNIALLMSDAPGFVISFINLGSLLQKDGHNVFYISDSESVSEEFTLNGGNISNLICFDKFLKSNDNSISDEVNRFNLGLFADFERLQIYYKANKFEIDSFFRKSEYLYSFFEKAIKQHSLEFLISEKPAGSYTFAASHVAKLKGISFLGFELSRINGFTEVYLNDKNLKLELTPEENQKVKEKLDSYILESQGTSYQKPIYMIQESLLAVNNSSILKRITNFERMKQLRYSLYLTLRNKKNYFGYMPIRKLSIHLMYLLRRILLKKFKKIFKSPSPIINSKKFNIVFPLHFHPEASTSMMSSEFFNEIDLLTFICSTLPLNYKIYIKDHPSMIGRRSKNDAKKLKTLPNSVFIDASTNIDYINKVDAIITLTSTMGLELAMKGKKVISFGEVFYNEHPNVKHVSSKHECMRLLFKIQDWKLEEDLTNANKKFLENYAKSCIPASIDLSNSDESSLNELHKLFNRLVN